MCSSPKQYHYLSITAPEAVMVSSCSTVVRNCGRWHMAQVIDAIQEQDVSEEILIVECMP